MIRARSSNSAGGWWNMKTAHFTGVDTSLPNRVVRAALEARDVRPLAAYTEVRPEVKYGEKSRVDFLLRGEGLPDAYVEVKSVTLCRTQGLAEFPDSVTARGARHMNDLAADGARRPPRRPALPGAAHRLHPCGHRRRHRPGLCGRPCAGHAAGVETLCLGTRISPQGITLAAPLVLAALPR